MHQKKRMHEKWGSCEVCSDRGPRRHAYVFKHEGTWLCGPCLDLIAPGLLRDLTPEEMQAETDAVAAKMEKARARNARPSAIVPLPGGIASYSCSWCGQPVSEYWSNRNECPFCEEGTIETDF